MSIVDRRLSLYQGWLISQLETCSIDSPIVTPGPAIKEDAVGNRIPFVVQFTAESQHIAEFLDRFHSTPLLHRITNLHIVRSSDGESDHRVMLSIEALAMECGLAAETLPDPIASVWNGRQREAWLIDRRSMQEVTVFESTELTLPGIAGRVMSVDEDSLQLNLNGQLGRLELGQTLSEASFTQSK